MSFLMLASVTTMAVLGEEQSTSWRLSPTQDQFSWPISHHYLYLPALAIIITNTNNTTATIYHEST